MSMAPRPQTSPSISSPPNGSCVQRSGVDRHDVGVAHEQAQRRRVGVGALDAGHELGSRPGAGFVALDVEAGSLEVACRSASALRTSWPDSAVPSLTQRLRISACSSSTTSPVGAALTPASPRACGPLDQAWVVELGHHRREVGSVGPVHRQSSTVADVGVDLAAWRCAGTVRRQLAAGRAAWPPASPAPRTPGRPSRSAVGGDVLEVARSGRAPPPPTWRPSPGGPGTRRRCRRPARGSRGSTRAPTPNFAAHAVGVESARPCGGRAARPCRPTHWPRSLSGVQMITCSTRSSAAATAARGGQRVVGLVLDHRPTR